MSDEAPTCPISSGTLPYRRRRLKAMGGFQGGETLQPGIPAAIDGDLQSLIRTTNVLRDILRSLTSNRVVNNIHIPRQPNTKYKGDTNYSQYPAWNMVSQDTEFGTVYHKSKGKKDVSQKAEVRRTHRVEFKNQTQEDKDFKWSYKKKIK